MLAAVGGRAEALIQTQIPQGVDIVAVFPGRETDRATGYDTGAGQGTAVLVKTHDDRLAYGVLVARLITSGSSSQPGPTVHGVEPVAEQGQRHGARMTAAGAGCPPDPLAVRAYGDNGVAGLVIWSCNIDVRAIGDNILGRRLIAQPTSGTISSPPWRIAGIGGGHDIL